jgi:pimeloyl-ACP methyl ester carboxylesterase
MSENVEARPTHVRSADGTEIAVHVSGAGRPLVMVPGITSDHTTWRLAAPLLSREVSVHAVDRRGRGDSGDGPDYAIEREYDDVAAVVDAAADLAGTSVDLIGHSFGGNLAYGAMGRTDNVGRLLLYEGWPTPNAAHRATDPALVEQLESLLAADRGELALETFYREVARMTEAEVDGLKAAPTWPIRVAAARTIPRELRAFEADVFDPAAAAGIDAPVLLLVGADSPAELQADPEVVAEALPDARIDVLAGQAHLAHLADPETFTAHVLAFVGD